MPAQILHALFGETLITALCTGSKTLQRIQGDCRAVFTLGCQGPDIFCHSQMTRPVALEYGTLLHRRGFGDFAASLLEQALPAVPTDASSLGIYALGFMTHGILDRTCHPYIVYKSTPVSDAPRRGKPLSRGQCHVFFERVLDALMLEILTGYAVSAWDQAALADVCAHPPTGLVELLAGALARVFPERAGPERRLSQRIPNALKDCALFYRLTDPRKPARAAPPACVYPARFPLVVDYLNLRHGTWYYPTLEGSGDTRSFLDIYHDAEREGAASFYGFMSRYFATGCFPTKEAAEVLGSQGLSIKGADGKPCAPAKTGPLPLDAVFLESTGGVSGII